jgi:hypothetical protein
MLPLSCRATSRVASRSLLLPRFHLPFPQPWAVLRRSRKYAASEMADVKFCLAFVHYPGAFHANRKFLVPEDVKGVKVRPANATVASFVVRLGGTNVQASASEVRDIWKRA